MGRLGEPPRVQPTPDARGDLLEAIDAFVSSQAPPVAVGLACPGLIDPGGRVRKSFLDQIDGLDLSGLLHAAGASPVAVMNDVHAQALGHLKPKERLAVVGCGTRVGGAVLCSRRGEFGREQYQGEFGHIPCGFESDVTCECGADDCLDLAIAGFRLEQRFGKWWQHEDRLRTRVLDFSAGFLTRAIRAVQVCVGPDRIVVTGRLAGYRRLQMRVQESVHATIWTETELQFAPDTWSTTAAGLARMLDRKYNTER